MSWQAYVDTNLIGTGKVTHAAIVGQQGGIWAHSANFNLSAEEQKAIVGAHANLDQIRASGVRLASQKYITTTAEGRSIYGKKGADGCVIVKTKQAILVAVYVGPLQAGETTPVVENLADYLESVGY
ncbi:uncharacterized protein PHACADRAFT_259587 [Phanerochaete carnosa HHB-10118-sp]|uniref:Profilin n=1 Tax=Phanerochaete carnosa (strain HHB-10118-sp) TaxID=650164 RepID=K5UTQ4_PHACS|nr:uncharacterized protein PHACADRAFT_259587 [Phanerochaete carnosa HHB-10118-sp]EKM53316.1 hypothetical protein PHACADRAFT_259587 [Phanerochaete carnosa HHB-10118-sp]